MGTKRHVKVCMHKERHFVHGTPNNIFYINEWIPASEAVEKSPLCHSEKAQRPKNLNYIVILIIKTGSQLDQKSQIQDSVPCTKLFPLCMYSCLFLRITIISKSEILHCAQDDKLSMIQFSTASFAGMTTWTSCTKNDTLYMAHQIIFFTSMSGFLPPRLLKNPRSVILRKHSDRRISII